jgi:TonB-dependent starch-binding outer membrane protein SusC
MRSPALILLGGILFLGVAATANGQSPGGTIQGVVRSQTGAPLEAATVAVVGTRFGAQSRSDGRYTIAGVAPGTYTVRTNRLGFAAREQQVVVTAGAAAVADFTLNSTAVALEQVVVVGYGTQSRRDVTGSVASVSNADIATMPVPRVDQAIAGLVSGVQVQTVNAQPGAQLRIRIRGGNSLQGSNEPLVVVDGVIGADLNQINPNDIESVDVLKDASATAIYGARGANGVILVTTQRGRPGDMRFEYSGYTGVQSPSKYIELLSADEFARMYMRNPNHDKTVSFDTTASLPTTDWQRTTYRSAPMQDHEMRITGSTGGTSLMAGASLFQQQGIVTNSQFNRGSARFNLDQNLGRRVKAGTRLTYSRSVEKDVRVNDGYGSAGGPITMMALRFAPTIPVYAADGSYSGPLLAAQTMDNPLAIANLREDRNTTNYLLGNLFATISLMKDVDFRTSVSYTSRGVLGQGYNSRLLRQFLGQGQATINNADNQTALFENTITGRHSLGKSDFTVLGGVTAQETKRSGSNETGTGFATDALGYRRLNLAELVTGGSSSSRDRLLSFLGRVNYGYAGKYLLTASFRGDGASKFAENNKWAYFPSFAAAWRVSDEEAFKRMLPVVSELKLRGGWGRTGSEAISAYQSLASWSIGSPYVIGKTRFNNGANPSRNSNPNLRWETTAQTDLGLDMGLMENRISLTFDAYKKTTTDLLYNKQVPYYTGYEQYVTNIGSVENHGMEFGLDTRHNIGQLDVRLGGNLSFNRNKVLDLGGDLAFYPDGVNGSLPNFRPAAIVRVGEPLGNFYGYVWDGIFQTDAEAAAAKAAGQADAKPGAMKLKDVNGDGKIDPNDRTILGNAQPKYTFGQTGTFSYRAISLSYLLRGSQGNKVVNLNRQGMETPGDNVNTLRNTLAYWSPTNPTNSMTGIGIGPFGSMSSRWVEDGSFVRLQNVTLGWEVPPRLTSRANLSGVRLYVSGQNLKTWTDYSWYDPEASSRGVSDLELGWDDSSYPGVRTFTVGLNLGF